MNFNKILLAVIAALSLAAGSAQARPRIGFAVNFNVPCQPAQMAPHYVSMHGYQYYWSGTDWYIWNGYQWLIWDGYNWVSTQYCTYNCFRSKPKKHHFRPQVSFGFGSKHGGFGFSF